MWRRIILVTAILCAFSLVLSSCNAPEPLSAERQARLNELCNEFVKEIQTTILPQKDQPLTLAELGYVVSLNRNNSFGVEKLTEFMTKHEAAEDTSVTMLMYTDALVIARVVFEGADGYYMRYQYSPKQKDSTDFELTGKGVTTVTLDFQESVPMYVLNLSDEQTDLATFKFVNPADATAIKESLEHVE